MQIRGLTQFSLLDFPGHIACVVFCGGCNFRCPYCQNPYLVLYPETQPLIVEEEFFDFLNRRRGKLDGVVISGGEPTTRPPLLDFTERIKAMGFLVRLDTNGSRPDIIEICCRRHLIDSLGIDYKGPAARYNDIALAAVDDLADKVRRTINLAREYDIDLDIRTTIHRALLSPEDMKQMRRELDDMGVGTWYLQQFHRVEIIDESLLEEPTYTDDELTAIAAEMDNVQVRGID